MDKVLLKHNAYDRNTGVDYPAGTYDLGDEAGQITPAFRDRLVGAGYAEDLSEESLSKMNKDDLVRVAEAQGKDVDASEKKEKIEKAVKK